VRFSIIPTRRLSENLLIIHNRRRLIGIPKTEQLGDYDPP
jgi:hypothetical protein